MSIAEMILAKCRKCGADAGLEANTRKEFYYVCGSGLCWVGPNAATPELAAEAWNAIMGEPKSELDEKPKTCGECAWNMTLPHTIREITTKKCYMDPREPACPSGVKRSN